MKRHDSKPFWRESKQAYYCWIDGRQRSLGKKKREADRRYLELVAAAKEGRTEKPLTVRECFTAYLKHCEEFKPNTLRNRTAWLDAFAAEAKVGKLPCSELTIEHVEAWLKTKAWSSSTERSAINAIQAALNFCVDRGRIPANPIKGIKKPAWKRRKHIISTDDQRTVYEAAKGPLREILTVLGDTGARPAELCSARIEQYRDGVIVLEEHKQDEHGEDRIIYLTPASRAIVERLIGERQSGPIFRNSRGQAWKPDTLYCRLKRMRKKMGLGDGVFPYSYRHRFASDAINKKRLDSLIVARLIGHSDAKTLQTNYYRGDDDILKKVAEELTTERQEQPKQ